MGHFFGLDDVFGFDVSRFGCGILFVRFLLEMVQGDVVGTVLAIEIRPLPWYLSLVLRVFPSLPSFGASGEVPIHFSERYYLVADHTVSCPGATAFLMMLEDRSRIKIFAVYEFFRLFFAHDFVSFLMRGFVRDAAMRAVFGAMGLVLQLGCWYMMVFDVVPIYHGTAEFALPKVPTAVRLVQLNTVLREGAIAVAALLHIPRLFHRKLNIKDPLLILGLLLRIPIYPFIISQSIHYFILPVALLLVSLISLIFVIAINLVLYPSLPWLSVSRGRATL